MQKNFNFLIKVKHFIWHYNFTYTQHVAGGKGVLLGGVALVKCTLIDVQAELRMHKLIEVNFVSKLKITAKSRMKRVKSETGKWLESP